MRLILKVNKQKINGELLQKSPNVNHWTSHGLVVTGNDNEDVKAHAFVVSKVWSTVHFHVTATLGYMGPTLSGQGILNYVRNLFDLGSV